MIYIAGRKRDGTDDDRLEILIPSTNLHKAKPAMSSSPLTITILQSLATIKINHVATIPAASNSPRINHFASLREKVGWLLVIAARLTPTDIFPSPLYFLSTLTTF